MTAIDGLPGLQLPLVHVRELRNTASTCLSRRCTDGYCIASSQETCETDLYLFMMRADHQQGSLLPQVFKQICPDCTQSPGNTIPTFITNHNPGSTVRFMRTLNAKRPKLQFQPKSGPQAMNVRVCLGSQAASTAPAACL